MARQRKFTPSPLFEFRWPLHEGRYSWMDIEPLPGVRLASDEPQPGPPIRSLVAVSGTVEKYFYPLRKRPGLFMRFASLKIDGIDAEQNVQAFAREYGMLGPPASDIHQIANGSKRRTVKCESLDVWRREVSEVRTIAELITAINKEPEPDLKFLENRVVWHEEEITADTMPVGQPNAKRQFHRWVEIEPGEQFAIELTGLWEEYIVYGDSVSAARHLIQAKINEKVKQLGLIPQLVWNMDFTRLQTQIRPSGLLAAMWVQICEAVSGQKNFMQCAGCGEWWEIGAQVRSNQRTCSEECKEASRRNRERDAIKLAYQGWSVERIASHLGSSERAIRGWLKKKGKK